MKILEKVLVSVLSTLILSLLLAIIVYTPEVERMANVYYEPFYGLFIIYFVYSLPVYVVGGVLYSFIVDKSLNRIQFQNKLPKYFTQFFLYTLGGIIVMGIYLAILHLATSPNYYGEKLTMFDSVETMIYWLLLGAIASLLFFHISIALRKTKELIIK